MTMHLLGPAYSTTRTRKPRAKLSKARQQQLTDEWHEHNRWLKQNRIDTMTFDEYQEYVCGRAPNTQSTQSHAPQTTESPHADRMRAHKSIPSHGIRSNSGVCAAKESPKYTGTYVKGISTMHKSNAVPVVDDEHIKDIAHMRR